MRVALVTLGCDKNTVDNEYLAGLLERGGCELIVADAEGRACTLAGEPAPGPLDAAVVTTCGFIDKAKQQSIESIVDLAERKRASGSPRRLFVAGCLAQRYADALLRDIPEIDGLVGVGQYTQLAKMILDADAAEQQRDVAAKPQIDIYQHMQRRRLERAPHAFLKVSDGCNHTCTFCSIPIMKGRLRSVPKEILLEEARRLIAEGVKEINLVAQDLSMYGMDRKEEEWREVRLPQLLRELCALEGDFWVRCLYYYPGLVTDGFLEVLATEPKIVKYLDMPLQHLDEGVLKRMKRPFASVNSVDLVARLRRAVPGITLRTTMIVGFPGESELEHRRMLELIEQLEFDRLGAFQYSLEEDTPAGQMSGQIAKRTRESRWRAVMETQTRIARRLNARRIGRRERVLIESRDPHREAWVGRGTGEAPEIDGKIIVTGSGAQPGEFAEVTIRRADACDFEGELA